MKAIVENGYLILHLKLQKPHPSKSGKSMLIATTRGPRRTNLKWKGKTVRVIANAFYDKAKRKESQ